MDTDVMRQAVTKLILGLCLVLAPPGVGQRRTGRGRGTDRPARRLIREGDRAAAVTLLEDTLAECPAADRPALLVLLRQSYEAMARQAEAAGRADDAAEYRDNLSILDRARDAAPRDAKSPPHPQPTKPRPQPAKPHPQPAKPRVERTPAPARKEAGRTGIAAARCDPARTGGGHAARLVRPARLASPEARPGPAGAAPSARARQGVDARADAASLAPAPAPETGMSRVPRSSAPTVATPDRTREFPMPRDGGRGLSPDPPDGREMPVNPGAATAEAAPGPPRVAPDAARPDPATRARPGSRHSHAGRWTGQRGRGRSAVPGASLQRVGPNLRGSGAAQPAPGGRRPHWAYCRFEAVVRRINARPRSPREWDEIEAEVRSIQRLTPGNWYAEYLINKIAEARHVRRRPPRRPTAWSSAARPPRNPRRSSSRRAERNHPLRRPVAGGSSADRAGRPRSPSSPPIPPTGWRRTRP